MENEMIERVAKALQGDIEAGPSVHWAKCLRAARAAIEAMRGPTAAMEEVGWRLLHACASVDEDGTVNLADAVEDAFNAMIDAALAEGQPAA